MKQAHVCAGCPSDARFPFSPELHQVTSAVDQPPVGFCGTRWAAVLAAPQTTQESTRDQSLQLYAACLNAMLRRFKEKIILRKQAGKASKSGNGASAAPNGINATQPHRHDPQEEANEQRVGSVSPQDMLHNKNSGSSDSSNGSAVERAVAAGCAVANCPTGSSSINFPSAHRSRLCQYCEESEIPDGFAQCDMCAYLLMVVQVRADKPHAGWPCRAVRAVMPVPAPSPVCLIAVCAFRKCSTLYISMHCMAVIQA